MTNPLDEVFAPFTIPDQAPQLESEEGGDLSRLFYEAPPWDPESGAAAEVATLFRNHVALRSALRFALEKAGAFESELRVLDEPREVFRAQGKVTGLLIFINSLMSHLEEAEKPKEKENEHEQIS